MLSILIPTYNYNVEALVHELHAQSTACEIDFEILCYDDGSKNLEIIEANSGINLLKHTTYKVLDSNIGRSAIRNLLAKDAKYDLLLFLDADVIPVKNDFISKYLNSISDSTNIIYGGIRYQETPPEKKQLLRWIYGKKREALPVVKRNKNVYLSFLTLNFIIQKNTFNTVCFNEAIPNLRNEDTLFSYNLKQKKIPVVHIENLVYHLGLEDSKTFLNKAIESQDAMNLFLEEGLIDIKYTAITKTIYRLKKTKLDRLFSISHPFTKKVFKANLLSKKPSLFIFDLYKLSYLCYISKNE
ncbi:glycosyltransferase [Flavobacteriaceae bacterium]|nr:glycosyltransferase [Flavobacteriaceae bacterium]MDC1472380.1 glycosyltransferase [Flavobacteriaceae bacterium]MDC1539263.1 glycosyltransferase [Flavobacteriaceae bacterium]